MVAVVSGAALSRATLFRRRQLAWAGALQYRCVFDDAATNASNATLAFDDDGGGYVNDDDDSTVSVVEYYGEEPDGGLGWVCRGGGADEGEFTLAQRGGGVRAWGVRWLRLDGLFRRGDGAFECAAGQRCARRSNPGRVSFLLVLSRSVSFFLVLSLLLVLRRFLSCCSVESRRPSRRTEIAVARRRPILVVRAPRVVVSFCSASCRERRRRIN